MSRGPELRGRAARLARLLPSGPSGAARAPFVLLVVLLLSGGLITLLMLNASLNEGSFQVDELKKKTTELTDEEQELQREVNDRSAPDALQRRARELGMVPGGDPAFLDPDGGVRGVPGAAPSALLAPPPKPAPGAKTGPGAKPETSGSRKSPAGATESARAGSTATPHASTARSARPTSTPPSSTSTPPSSDR